LPQAALIAGRCRRELEALAEQRQQLEEERALILKFRPFFAAFTKIGESGLDLDGIRVFYLILKEDGEEELRRMRAAFRQALGDGFELLSQPSESGESAMLLAVPSADGAKAEQLLSEAGVQALSLPDQFEEESVGGTIHRMQARLEKLPAELATIERERKRIAGERGRDLARIQATVRDLLATIEAMEKAFGGVVRRHGTGRPQEPSSVSPIRSDYRDDASPEVRNGRPDAVRRDLLSNVLWDRAW
jgi:hypothetical protein